MSKNGLILLTPTSIAYTGTSATISANGSVSFLACSSLSLNGVFSADYDNYMIVCRADVPSGNGLDVSIRLRSGGSDNSTASSYVAQYLRANGTAVTGGRETSNGNRFFTVWTTQRGGFAMNVYGPFLAQPTAGRTISAENYTNADLFDFVWTHNQSTSYDGCTLFMAVGSWGGRVAVYGMRK